MRIVAGEAGGRALKTLEGGDVRPTMDRVREATFNSLFSHDLIEDRTYLDLFAGSGAMGLEALSRGAASCTFVDSSRAAIRVIEHNIAELGYQDQATVRSGDAFAFLGGAASFDVVVLDPHYNFEGWDDLLTRLADLDVGALVIESSSKVEPGPAWQILKSKRYASTIVTIACRAEGPDEQESENL